MNRTLITIVILLGLSAGAGCGEVIRIAPTESIKQTAELTNRLAQMVNTTGAEAQSPTTRKLVDGTQVSLTYMGRPKIAPSMNQFDAITRQGRTDAEKGTDVWQLADAALELGIGLAALFGGVGGVRLVGFLRGAREKSVALQEIVRGNEMFKKGADSIVREAFKVAHNTAQVSNGTKMVVAKTKLI